MSRETEVRTAVRRTYGRLAGQEPSAGGGPEAISCCGSAPAAAETRPAGSGLSCGDPVTPAMIKAGEIVVDLGAGPGADCFLAAEKVGHSGRVIGVDMTPSMIEKARANAAKAGYANVEFRLGEIEHLPAADASVDCIISNCVVNLSPDKPQVFREAHRALKPGGRMLVSDLVLTRPLSPALQTDVALYVGCIAGAALRDDYLRMIREAGFADVEVVAESGYTVGLDTLPEGSPEREAFAAVLSVKVRARKR